MKNFILAQTLIVMIVLSLIVFYSPFTILAIPVGIILITITVFILKEILNEYL